jgi:mono/diheme cytochrome c family protein
VIAAGVLLATLLAGCALSAPPPPRGSAPILTPLPAPEAVFELPARMPSVAEGAAIYAEKCAACHGPSGKGDGEQAAQIQSTFGVAPADLTSEQTARTSTVAEWFGLVTAGRLDENGQPRGMPGFSGSLSVDDRWDVIAYVWSLGSPEPALAQGEAIYAERCVQCHGDTGKGDGPQADGSVPDLSDLAVYRDAAFGAWDNALQSTHVPSFSGKLNGPERSAVIDYVRSFTYDSAPAVAEPEPAATPALDAAAAGPDETGLTVNGTIANGTGGVGVPANLEVTLYHFPGGTGDAVITRTVTTDEAGAFTASYPDITPGDIVMASLTYADVTYRDGLEYDGTTSTADLEFQVFEPTSETDAIRLETLHVIAMPGSDAIDVNEIYVISNLGDRVVLNTTGEPALRFNLPEQASAVQLLDGAVQSAFAESPEGFDYYEAVPPGEDTARLVISYQLPLGATDAVFDRMLNYPAQSVNVLVASEDWQGSSSQLLDQGPQVIQGQTYQQFSGGLIAAGQTLALRLTPPRAAVDPKLAAGIAILLVGVAVVGYGVWRTRAQQEQPSRDIRPARKAAPADREALIDQIAALDDAFEAGEIEEARYRKQREALKARAVRLMREE